MKITVKRYDPSKDNAPYETTYEVPHDDEYMTLLQALVYSRERGAAGLRLLLPRAHVRPLRYDARRRACTRLRGAPA